MHNASSDFLLREFVDRKTKNTRYSERAFARAAGVSPGFLKLVFQGKRSLSLEKARAVADRLGWTGPEAEQFLAIVQNEKKSRRLDPSKVTVEQFTEISDWFHFALMELLKVIRVASGIPGRSRNTWEYRAARPSFRCACSGKKA
jgi:hypothetical protein